TGADVEIYSLEHVGLVLCCIRETESDIFHHKLTGSVSKVDSNRMIGGDDRVFGVHDFEVAFKRGGGVDGLAKQHAQHPSWADHQCCSGKEAGQLANVHPAGVHLEEPHQQGNAQHGFR